MSDIDLSAYRIDGSKPFDIGAHPTSVASPIYKDKADAKGQLSALVAEIDKLQQKMYAHDRHGMLCVFQAMDAAGKDGTIARVFGGVNPHGIKVNAFKRPSDEEIDHSYLWRTDDHMPARGTISIFNRSYYEEVLVVRVHPEIVSKYQRIPKERIGDLDELWKRRYEHIRSREATGWDNGITTVKFFLHVSRDEQARRFISRIDRPEKNWKFSSGDLKERACWADYQAAYEDAINESATPQSPWYCIPADDKRTMRILVAAAVKQEIAALPMEWPKLSEEETAELAGYREQLEGELGASE